MSTRGRVYFLSRAFAFSFDVCRLKFANTCSLISTPDLCRPAAQIRRWRKSEKKKTFFRMGNYMYYYPQTRPWYFNLFTKSASCSLLKETHLLCLHFSFSSWKFASSNIKRQKIETRICFLSLTFRSEFFWFLLLFFYSSAKEALFQLYCFPQIRDVVTIDITVDLCINQPEKTADTDFATPPLLRVSPRNDVRETSFQHSISKTGESLPRSRKCFWLVENWKFPSTNQKHALPSSGVAKCQLFSQAMYQLASGFEDQLGAGV